MHGQFGFGIGDAAYMVGVTVDRLKYAERIKALKRPPRINNRPCYDRAAIEAARRYFENRKPHTRSK